MKNTELAKKIKELRTRKGLSQDELSIAAQLNLRTIQRIESGETEPRGDTLKRLASALQVTPNDLIDYTEDEDPTMLMLLNISALSFIAFPILGVIIPLVLWISKKDKIKHFNTTGKKLLNFQISWCLAQFIIFITVILINPRHISGLGMNSSELILVMSIPLMYFSNSILILVNTYRCYKNKTVWYKPAISFIK